MALTNEELLEKGHPPTDLEETFKHVGVMMPLSCIERRQGNQCFHSQNAQTQHVTESDE